MTASGNEGPQLGLNLALVAGGLCLTVISVLLFFGEELALGMLFLVIGLLLFSSGVLTMGQAIEDDIERPYIDRAWSPSQGGPGQITGWRRALSRRVPERATHHADIVLRAPPGGGWLVKPGHWVRGAEWPYWDPPPYQVHDIGVALVVELDTRGIAPHQLSLTVFRFGLTVAFPRGASVLSHYMPDMTTGPMAELPLHFEEELAPERAWADMWGPHLRVSLPKRMSGSRSGQAPPCRVKVVQRAGRPPPVPQVAGWPLPFRIVDGLFLQDGPDALSLELGLSSSRETQVSFDVKGDRVDFVMRRTASLPVRGQGEVSRTYVQRLTLVLPERVDPLRVYQERVRADVTRITMPKARR